MGTLAAVALAPEEFLRSRLTDSERESFATSGFLLVRGSLPAPTLEKLRSSARREAQDSTVVRMPLFSSANGLADGVAAVELLTRCAAFPKAVDIMGVNIWANDAWVQVLDESHPMTACSPDTYSNECDLDLERPRSERPRLWLSCLHFLTPGTAIIVHGGSHHDVPAGAVPTILRPDEGDALICDRRLSYSYPSTPGVIACVQYAYRWLRPCGAMSVEDSLSRTFCPVARQLLGCTTTMAGLYHGTGRDIPLRLWLSEQLGVGADASTWSIEKGLGFELRKDDQTFGLGLGDHVGSSIVAGDQLGHASHPRNPAGLLLPAGPTTVSDLGLGWARDDVEAALDGAGVDWSKVTTLTPQDFEKHRLTPAERAAFDRDGYCIITVRCSFALIRLCQPVFFLRQCVIAGRFNPRAPR